jgi:hypothetical protein
MPPILKEAVEWLTRAEQAREVAGQLTDPGERQAVLELAESFDRLARAAATPAVLRRRRGKTGNETGDFSRAFRGQTPSASREVEKNGSSQRDSNSRGASQDH